MEYFHAILAVNFSCITVLVILAMILLIATRFRGENGYAAAIITIPTVPVYLYNMSRMLEWHEFTLIMLPLAYSVNTLLMPLLWMFTRRNFDNDFKLGFSQLWHLLPMIICLVICAYIGTDEWEKSIRYEMSGDDTWIGDINSLIVTLQLLIYFPSIFIYIFRRRKKIMETQSDAEWVQKLWIFKFMALFAILFVIVMVAYAIYPRTDAWLIQILNVIAMVYLTYYSIVNPTISQPKTHQEEKGKYVATTFQLSESQMQEICERARSYLLSSKRYLSPDLTLAILAQEMEVSQKYLSRSINLYLKCNFFELINKMRVEEAKQQLLNLDSSGYNIDSIYTECGFKSRSTFFLVFKKITGQTPATWLLGAKKNNLRQFSSPIFRF